MDLVRMKKYTSLSLKLLVGQVVKVVKAAKAAKVAKAAKAAAVVL